MKQLIFTLCTLLLLVGCTESPIDEIGEIGDAEFYATIEGLEDTTSTKTYVDGQIRMRWTAEDKITMFNKTTYLRQYTFTGKTGANAGGFKKTSTDDEFWYGADVDNIYAVYPYSEDITLDETSCVLTLDMPAEQSYAENSFGLGANTMVAVSTSGQLAFKNVCSWLRVRLYGENASISSVTLTSLGDEAIAGEAEVTATLSGNPTCKMTGTTKSIKLTCAEPVQISNSADAPTDFWIVVPPVTLQNGLSVTVEDVEGGTQTYEVNKSFTFERNKFYNLKREVDLTGSISAVNVPNNEIWYTTKTNAIIDYLGKGILGFDDIGLNGKPFDVNIVDHFFDGKKCVIRCDGPITRINNRCFSVDSPELSIITEILLPNSVKEIGRYCFNMADITEFRTPDNLQSCISPFINNPKLKTFTGKHTDGQSIIINDVLYIYAPGADNESYIIPNGVTEIGSGAFDGAKFKMVTIPGSVRKINYEAFQRSLIETITIPQSVEYIGDNAFDLCFELQGFFGNSRFVTDDNMCFITDDYKVSGGKQLNAFVGHYLSSYSIPEGITSIRTMSFHYGGENLVSVTLPKSIVNVAALAFKDLPKLQYIYGPGTTDDNKGYVKNGELQFFLGRGIKSYYIPEDVTALGDNLFEYNDYIESVVLHDNVTTLGTDCFANCQNLKSITLSAKISTFPFYCFKRSYNIEKVYFRSLEPPKMIDATCPGGFFPEKEYENLTIYVPSQSKEKYLSASGWEEFIKYVKEYEYTDLPEIDYYISTDYSNDGKVNTLQTATKGKGINIVLMGDAYSDRQIANGTYKADMENMYNNLFIEEPYKSFKDYFNVYYVNVVSATEGYEYGNTALDGYFGDGTKVGGYDNAVFYYALRAISEEAMDEALLIVAMNSNNYAGTCYMYSPNSGKDYGTGVSVSYFPKGGDPTVFAQLLHHEACGHGFAKLADEYAYEDMGTAPSDYVSQIQAQQNSWGWWKNVDFTSDKSAIRWNYFINDARYANDGLGAYEGGLTYWSGVWRPTENSIMRHNTGGFNAPSREAIYYRIHKLAYGTDWEYDYEDFVEWDARNRATSASTRAMVYKPANYKPTHPPVIVNKSWKDN